MAEADSKSSERRSLDLELDQFERSIEELRLYYEQYFIDILPHPPEKLHHKVKLMMRRLLKAPFKNSANRFRLRTLIQRYQTFDTYWERILKQREEGTYSKDVFKAEMRQKMLEEADAKTTQVGAAEKSIRDLFSSYQNALSKTGIDSNRVNYDAFKKSILEKAKNIKQQHGVTKLHYKIVVKEGKVVVKASAKH